MKKITVVALAMSGAACLLFSGCASVMSLPPSGVAPGMLFSDVNYPSMHEAQTKFSFQKSDIEILGPVQSISESSCILGMFATGDNGYGNLLQIAQRTYPGADGVVNIQWDTDYTSILCGLYCKVTATVDGTAFKFKK